jgi:hypothetical protein
LARAISEDKPLQKAPSVPVPNEAVMQVKLKRAHSILEALTGTSQFGPFVEKIPADINKDGVLYVDELITYAANRVKDLTGGEQHLLSDPGGITAFPIAVVGPIKLFENEFGGATPKSNRCPIAFMRSVLPRVLDRNIKLETS